MMEGDFMKNMTAEVWKRIDIILESAVDYADPYNETDIDAVFTHEDGTEIKLYGFWNGGREFRVRFAPTKTGFWKYEITCSDETNTGLHGIRGEITAVENTGKSKIDRHGFVKISENGRYLTYDDGTPFFWLGDTNWQAPNYVSVTKCNYPGCTCKNQFMHELKDRLKKGFNVYQTYFDVAELDGGGQRDVCGEPSFWTVHNKVVNPATFTDKIDVMFDALAEHGMVIALGYGVHSCTVNNIALDELKRISRYLTARYTAYPIVWITAQEITGDEQFDAWVESAKIVEAGDGYCHPQGAHQFPMSVDNRFIEALDRESWHEVYILQGGHGPMYQPKRLYEGYYQNTRSGRVKPMLETEANYEDLSCGGFNGYAASRIGAWRACLLGSCGFTYGVTGVWANCTSTAGNTGWLHTYSHEPWYMGIDKPGSYEMTYLARFFEYADFSTLIPRFNSAEYSDLSDEMKAVASSGDGRTYAAYFADGTRSAGELRGLNREEVYSAKWYDPRTGKFVEICDAVDVTEGVYTVPEKPNCDDWALLVTSRTDLGEYPAEAYNDYAEKKADAEFAGEKQIPRVFCSGSCIYSADGVMTDTVSALFDGDGDTEWIPFAPIASQTIAMDLGAVKKLCGMEVTPGKDAVIPPYRIYASADGEDWTILADRLAGSDKVREVLTGEYRYIRLLWFGAESNQAVKTIADIALYAE